jgi:hypothetical protein
MAVDLYKYLLMIGFVNLIRKPFLELTKKRVLLFKVFIFLFYVLILTVSFGYSNFHCFVGLHKKGPSDDSTCFWP